VSSIRMMRPAWKKITWHWIAMTTVFRWPVAQRRRSFSAQLDVVQFSLRVSRPASRARQRPDTLYHARPIMHLAGRMKVVWNVATSTNVLRFQLAAFLPFKPCHNILLLSTNIWYWNMACSAIMDFELKIIIYLNCRWKWRSVIELFLFNSSCTYALQFNLATEFNLFISYSLTCC